eukprot:7684-Karenia_brevis.AAC.1
MARETRIGMKDFNYSILSGLTHLERLSIHEPTIRDYQQRLDVFLAWLRQSNITVGTVNDVDISLALFLDMIYFKGHSPEDGNKVTAAVKFWLRTFVGEQPILLTRTSRSLKGWRKSTPVFQRLPLPWVLVAAIIGVLVHRRQITTATAVI